MMNYRKITKRALLGAIVCCALLTVSHPASVYAEEISSAEMAVTNPIRIFGTVSHDS